MAQCGKWIDTRPTLMERREIDILIVIKPEKISQNLTPSPHNMLRKLGEGRNHLKHKSDELSP